MTQLAPTRAWPQDWKIVWLFVVTNLTFQQEIWLVDLFSHTNKLIFWLWKGRGGGGLDSGGAVPLPPDYCKIKLYYFFQISPPWQQQVNQAQDGGGATHREPAVEPHLHLLRPAAGRPQQRLPGAHRVGQRSPGQQRLPGRSQAGRWLRWVTDGTGHYQLKILQWLENFTQTLRKRMLICMNNLYCNVYSIIISFLKKKWLENIM